MADPYIPGQSGTSPFTANYAGDVTEEVMAQNSFGPDVDPKLHNHYIPVSADYDPALDRTAVQFQSIPRTGPIEPSIEQIPGLTRQQLRQYQREVKKLKGRR